MMNSNGICDDVTGAKMLPLSFLSYNCRGMNETKYDFLSSLLAQSDFLFLQEHWMAEDQVPSLGLLCTSHHCYGVSGFSSNDVLLGRPFGGCAIFGDKVYAVVLIMWKLIVVESVLLDVISVVISSLS